MNSALARTLRVRLDAPDLMHQKNGVRLFNITLTNRREIIARLPGEFHIPAELIFRAMTSPERSPASASQFSRP